MALNPGEVFSGGTVRDASGRIVVAVDPSSNYLPVPIDVTLTSNIPTSAAPSEATIGTGIAAYPTRNGGHPSITQIAMGNANQVRMTMTLEAYTTVLSLAATGGFDTSTGNLTVTAHGLSNNTPVSLHAATLPAAFTADVTTYFVTVVDANTLTFSAAPSGAAIVPATAGSTIIVGPVSFAAQISTTPATGASFTWFDGTAGSGVSILPCVALAAASTPMLVGPWVTVPSAAKGDMAVRAVSNNPTATTTANPVVSSIHLQFK